MAKKDNYSVKREMMDAFMELMAEKSYMDITVTDIVNTAQVARASFYRNFNSISDVIDAIMEELANEFEEDILPAISSNDERRWREFLFEHFYRLKTTHKKMSLISSQNIAVVFSRMDSKIQKLESELPAATVKDKYTAVGKLGLINSISKKWMDTGMKETPEEIINYIMSFITLF